MNLKTIAQIEKDLQNLADQVGESGFAKAKALYMEKVAVVDEEGTPLSADEIEVVLMPKPAEDKADMMEEDEEENMRLLRNWRKRLEEIIGVIR